MGGLLPFAVIFIELFYILKSVWEGQYYYMFGFLSLVFAILLVTCVEISIIVVYFQLCGEVSKTIGLFVKRGCMNAFFCISPFC